MNIPDKLVEWLQKHPIVLIRFNEEYSESLFYSMNGFEKMTFAHPHARFDPIKVPTICLLEVQKYDLSECYLGTITKKRAISTFDSRVTIKKLRIISPNLLRKIEHIISDTRMKHQFSSYLSEFQSIVVLSPMLSVHVIEALAKNPKNQTALETSLSLLPIERRIAPNVWAQEDAIRSALAAFGVDENSTAHAVILKAGKSSSLVKLAEEVYYEDNVIVSDATHIPGFKFIDLDITGKAIFIKGNENLTIYTANKLPLEEMLGVDLIYINETRGNIIMIQYKMLEEVKNSKGSNDWIFRPNQQLYDEIHRMQLPQFTGQLDDYRLNSNPFFFKFVKRKKCGDSLKSFYLSLDHLTQFLTKPDAIGPKGGVRLSYDALNGTYLRESDMLGLIRSGYIGTHKGETDALKTIIQKVAQGNTAIVLAWQQKIQEIAQ